jgi:phosphatidate phosphatase APP1
MVSRGAADVGVTMGDDPTARTRTDHEGYFELHVRLPPNAADTDTQVTLCIGEDPSLLAGPPVQTIVHRPSEGTERLIVSDVDDTILPMAAFGGLRATATVLFGDAISRQPFPGVGPFFRGLRAGARGIHRNLHYFVSSSPWNVYGILIEFLRVQQIPVDALLLRSWGGGGPFLRRPRSHRSHKSAHIDRILRVHAGLPVILVGDSSAEDPEIYRDVITRHPGRVAAIYIRDVGNPRRAREVEALAEDCRESGTDLVLAANTGAMADHASSRGWISAAAFASVRAELASA